MGRKRFVLTEPGNGGVSGLWAAGLGVKPRVGQALLAQRRRSPALSEQYAFFVRFKMPDAKRPANNCI